MGVELMALADRQHPYRAIACRVAAARARAALGYFLKMVEDLGTESKIAKGSSADLQAAFDAGMGNGNVPEIFDYYRTLGK